MTEKAKPRRKGRGCGDAGRTKFNLVLYSSPESPKNQLFKARRLTELPLTPKQRDYLTTLIAKSGKGAYLAAKERAGVGAGTTLLNLTRREAAALISILLESTNDNAIR